MPINKFGLNGFDNLKNNLLKDLATMRIIEPCSKLRSVELLKKYFAISYAEDSVYEGLPEITFSKKKRKRQLLRMRRKH